MNSKRPYGSFATAEHAQVARKVAEEGIVLFINVIVQLHPELLAAIGRGRNGVEEKNTKLEDTF